MTESTEGDITVLAKEFTSVTMELALRAMSDQCHVLNGQIVPQTFRMLDRPGKSSKFFDEEADYEARFVCSDVG